MPGGVDHKSQVLAATDIVELVGQTVKLRRAGRGFTGLCPFHTEKTPSFSVNPERQFFYCFGCKAGGNAIDFVMKRDRIEFVEALKHLAERAGINLPKFERAGESAGERQMLLDAQSAACAYFQGLMKTPAGHAAQAYLDKRGFDPGSIKRFQIGVAADAWDGLLTSNEMKKFPPDLLVKAGLLKFNESRNSHYDTFRNRLMFPIRDEQGRMIAFGGRVMPGSDDKAKYLNSPETPIFSKSKCAFGLDLARQKIVETRTVVVVEGYTDVIMCHQFGVTNVVSVLGTALTGSHVNLLRRYADRIVLLFDPDTAGDLAVNRAVELFLTQPIEVLVATLPEQLDPDEYLLEYGAEGFNKVIGEAQDALNYKWKQLEKRYHGSEGDLTGQQKAVEEYLTTLADARGSGPVDSLRWGAALTRVSRLTGIAPDDLNRRFKMKLGRPRAMGAVAVRSGDAAVDGEQSAVGQTPAPATSRPRGPLTAQSRAEREVLGCLLVAPKWWHEVQKHILLDDFCDERHHKMAEVYWDYQKNEGEPVFAEFLQVLEAAGLKDVGLELMQEFDGKEDVNGILSPAVDFLRYAREKRASAVLSAKIRQTNEQDESAVDLLKKLTDVAKRPDLRRGF